MDEQKPVSPVPQPVPQQPVQPTHKAVFDPSQIYPEAQTVFNPSMPAAGMAATAEDSALKGKINHTYGVTVMAVLLILSASFNLTRQSTTIIAQIAAVLDILLAVGLLFRFELARKFIVYLIIISLALQLISIPTMISTFGKARDATAQFDQTAQQEKQTNISFARRQSLDSASKNLHDSEDKVSKLYQRVYISLGILMAVEIVEIAYLTRPKVKSVFH